MVLIFKSLLLGSVEQGATIRMKKVLGRNFEKALGLIDNMGGRSHPQPPEIKTPVPFSSKSSSPLSDPLIQLHQHQTHGSTHFSATLPQTPPTPAISPIPSQIQLVQRLIQSGRGSDHLRIYFETSAEMKVFELASFIDDPSRPLSRGFVDGFFERLCCESSNRACRLTERVWELMTRDNFLSKVQLSRLIQSVVDRQSSAEVVLIPLFISDLEWVLVAVFFTGTVRVLCNPSFVPREKTLQPVRKLVRLLGVPVSSVLVEPVQLLPANSTFGQMFMLRSAVLLIGDPLLDVSADIALFTRAVALFVLGQNSLFFSPNLD